VGTPHPDGSLRARLKNLVPREIRHLRWGDHDPLRRRAWGLLAGAGGGPRARALYTSKSRYFDDVYSLHADPAVASAFADMLPHDKVEGAWVLDGPALIEPGIGWIIADTGQLVDNCLIDAWARVRPPVREYFRARLRPNEVVRVPAVLHLRDSGEANYYHVLNDLIGGRLRLAQQCGVGPDVPVLVGRDLYRQPFFQDLLRMSSLGRREIIVQDGRYVRSERTFFFQTQLLNVSNAEYVTRLLGAPEADPKADRRVFLTRGKAAGRGLVNAPEVEEVCRRYGFEVVDTAGMSLAEQVGLFSATRHLVGIHGAGLYNIIFRRNAPLSLLELQPPLSYGVPDPRSARVPYAQFFWWAHALGFGYDLLIGSEVPGLTPTPYQPFAVDAAAFEAKLGRMLGRTA
jgi:hypothetical protein